MFKKNMPEPSLEEKLAEARKQRQEVEFWIDNGGWDSQHPDDAKRVADLINLEKALEGKIAERDSQPPKEPGFFGRMFRR